MQDVHKILAFFHPLSPMSTCLTSPPSPPVDVHFIRSHFSTVPLSSYTSISSQYSLYTLYIDRFLFSTFKLKNSQSFNLLKVNKQVKHKSQNYCVAPSSQYRKILAHFWAMLPGSRTSKELSRMVQFVDVHCSFNTPFPVYIWHNPPPFVSTSFMGDPFTVWHNIN